jgi:hypothetical protein
VSLTRPILASISLLAMLAAPAIASENSDDLAAGFTSPPASARPWVYWFWMDGNLSREGITADLEAMKNAGIGGVIIMEVDVGIPKGPVRFMSPPWRELFRHVAAEAARLGIEITLNSGPGWTGSGGPWVKPEQSMQKVVFSETAVQGRQRFEGRLPQPPSQEGFYRDIAVLAFPTPAGSYRLPDIQEKALYTRGYYSSAPGVRSSIPAPARYPEPPPEQTVPLDRIADLTPQMDSTGRLTWDVPAGKWTIIRFGRTSTGANTRPAPAPGLGLECDKLDKAALDAHVHTFIDQLIADVGPQAAHSLVSLHIDSWEVGTQNWTAKFREEFQRLRGYDPLRYLPAMTGRVVGSGETSERFLWDLRQTVADLISENYARHLHTLAHQRGMRLSIEPYDSTPCDDMTYGSAADVPMCEFWANCFNTFYSCTEATSIAHTYGRPIIAAEAFTADDKERWQLHPALLKPLGDWAFSAGINRLVIHRYAHQPWLDRWPGMTMGPYGIHYERTQTWWEMVSAWNTYLSRCQFVLCQGLPVADICYLSPEGSPNVFRAPKSATRGTPPDRLGYNFDACTPEALLTRASVKDGRLVLPDGMSYRLLVLPQVARMTPALLGKVKELVEAGATVLGAPPLRSPSLSGSPDCDGQVKEIAAELWGEQPPPFDLSERRHGQGRVFWSKALLRSPDLDQESTQPLAQAKWIWHPEGNPAVTAAVGIRYFRRTLTIGPDERIKTARIFITADNSFELYVNARKAGSGSSFTQSSEFDLTPLLHPGDNLIAVAAGNGGDKPNPAGLIAALTIQFTNGQTRELHTDRQWQTAAKAPEGWLSDQTSAGQWLAAMEIGPLGTAPWGQVGKPLHEPEIYPSFDQTSAVLQKLGVSPDFEASQSLRYTHRRAGNMDIYFVANGDARGVQAACRFRVSGKIPEIWDPMTGRMSIAAVYAEKDGLTFLSLWLEPAGSLFIVFRKPTPASGTTSDKFRIVEMTRDGQDVLPWPDDLHVQPPAELLGREGGGLQVLARLPGRYELKTAAGDSRAIEVPPLPQPLELRGPWKVRFQPGRGAPESLTFDTLSDWSKHADPGVKYFSGTATYTKTFTLPPGLSGRDRRMELDLGNVQVMARVKLNGQDLGILWKPPFRADVTEATRSGDNAIEITVANLWPNRLIGDQSLPEGKRVASTTWNPFQKDTPLLESGLLGPVIVRTMQVIEYK